MAIEVRVGEVVRSGDAIWETGLSPREVRGLGPCSSGIDKVSVVLLEAFTYDDKQSALIFSPDSATVLNIGDASRTVFIAGGAQEPKRQTKASPAVQVSSGFGGGDRQFLRALGELPDGVRRAGEAILTNVREHFPGDLRAVGARRFQETPDNFWFVTIQPRDESLAITVRGLPERFPKGKLQVSVDRKPYSRFKVAGMADVAEATSIIRTAIRKGA